MFVRCFDGIKVVIRFNKIEFRIELMKCRMVQFIIIVLVFVAVVVIDYIICVTIEHEAIQRI